MTDAAKSTFVYVTFIRTTPERLWAALTDSETIKEYWFGMPQESNWTPGSPWRMLFTDGRVADDGQIVEATPPKRLVIKWRNRWNPEMAAEGDASCSYEIETYKSATKLTITHTIDRKPSKFIDAVSGGWPRILSNLKSYLETGQVAIAG